MLDDNSQELLRATATGSESLATIFPPPGTTQIKMAKHCMNIDSVFVLLDDGTLGIYKLKPGCKSELTKLQTSKDLRDELGHSLNEAITTFTFCKMIPPKFDCEYQLQHEAEPSGARASRMKQQLAFQSSKWKQS